MSNVTEPITITLKMHGVTHTVEGLDWDCSAEDLVDAFKRLLIGATFPPTVLNDEWGHYEYVDDTKINDDFQPMKVTEKDFNKFNDADWYGKSTIIRCLMGQLVNICWA